MVNWYNVELDKVNAEKLRRLLKERNIAFETSECYNLIHFEILLSEIGVAFLNLWLERECK